jgi:putative GTP pyrophosphokinase
MPLSQTQLQKLGERLKEGTSADDLRALAEYRLSFGPASDAVAQAVHACTGIEPMQRAAKSTQAILEKLRRQSTRLGSIQDIAGCRLTVSDCQTQAAAVAALMSRFPDAAVKDRRVDPSHGYRAVHLIVRHEGFRIEIQVRTVLQHTWALMSEMLADDFGNDVKYGGGPSEVRQIVQELSESIAEEEALEFELSQLEARIAAEGERVPNGVGHTRMLCDARLSATRARLNELMMSVPERMREVAR